jgi:hypothetical protein
MFDWGSVAEGLITAAAALVLAAAVVWGAIALLDRISRNGDEEAE